MTNHSLPTGSTGPEGDSEKKKWGYKRQQFDAVISTTRFNGAIDNLVNETVEVRTLLTILDELNTSNQRGRYMAEVLALKQESRRLATVPFSERVAEFLREGSRRIPWLSDGLASQMAVALASAADNTAYLDTVNAAVSNLLLDLSRPLKPDTRNYLRALTDKIDATRRLQEARGQLATVPSVYPPAIPEALANAQSPEPPPAQPAATRSFSGKPVATSRAAPPPKPGWREPGSLETAEAPKSDRFSEPASSDVVRSDPDDAAKWAAELQSELDADEQVRSQPGDAVAKAQVLTVGEATALSDADEYVDIEPTNLEPGPQPAVPQRTLMMPSPSAWREPGADAGSEGGSEAGSELEAKVDEPAGAAAPRALAKGRQATDVGLGPVTDAATDVHGSGELGAPVVAPIDPELRAGRVISDEQTITLDPDSQKQPAPIPIPSIPSKQLPATSRASLKPLRRPQKTPVSTAKIVTAQSASAAALSKPVGHTRSANIVRSVPPGIVAPGVVSTATTGQTAAQHQASHPPIGSSPIADGEALKIPVRGVPMWIVAVSVSGMIAGGVGIWLLVHNASRGQAAPDPSASAAPSAAASAGVRPKAPPSAHPPVTPPPPPPQQAAPPPPPPPQAAPPPPPPPPQAAPPPAAQVTPTPKAKAAPIVRTPSPETPVARPAPAAKPTPAAKPATAAKPVSQQRVAPVAATTPVQKPEAAKPQPKLTAPQAEPEPALTTPKPSRTIDDILVELLQIPNDSDSIEAKAHDVARIVARASRADADHILRRLIPEEVLAGSENVDTRTLEPVRRVVALLLKKVAVDKDDNRAALAIDSLGEWAKSRKHGGAAKLTLDQLAEDPVVLSRPKRLRALERVQARLGISNVGE